MADKEKFDRPVEANSELTEDSALALLSAPDVTPETCERLAKNGSLLKSRKVKVALVCHRRTPRHVSVPVARQLYTFDLMKVALSPTVVSDIKVAIDDILIARLKTLTIGERLTLARRATGRVAAALLVESELSTARADVSTDDAAALGREKPDKKRKFNFFPKDARVMQAALENPRLTEALLIKAILSPRTGFTLIDVVARHAKWSKRREVRVALLRTEYLPLAKALEYSREVPTGALLELLGSSRLPEPVKILLCKGSKSYPT